MTKKTIKIKVYQRIVYLLTILLVFPLNTVLFTSTDIEKKIFESSKEFFINGDYKKAKKVIEEFTSDKHFSHENNFFGAKFYLLMGACCEKLGDYKNAKKNYLKAENFAESNKLNLDWIKTDSLPQYRMIFEEDGIYEKQSKKKKKFWKSPFFILGAVVIIGVTAYFLLKEDKDEKTDEENGFQISGPISVDHNCTNISQIPEKWIQEVKSFVNLHFAHTSHGEQIICGLSKLESQYSNLQYDLNYNSLPDSSNLCIMDGQLNQTYITPDLYWSGGGSSYTRQILNKFSKINVSMWAWCSQLNYYSKNQVSNYLNKLEELEEDFPDVVFVYMTCNAQAGGSDGYNRYLRNEQIREFCRKNDKVLFDFADLDSWYNGNRSTYQYNNQRIPVEHPHYSGDQCGHTNYANCLNKGKALWWMLAEITGWRGVD